MLLRHSRFMQGCFLRSTCCCFSTASPDYYKILEVQKGATRDEIHAAYTELTAKLDAVRHLAEIKRLSEAFVILSDHKSRDAYDSLLKVNKTSYISDVEKEQVPMEQSYLAKRKNDKLKDLKRLINIDDMGRYRGGLPNRKGIERGKAAGPIGFRHTQEQIETELDPNPEFPIVTEERAQSFKDFHQDERVARTQIRPWFTFKVDYDYFTGKKLRKNHWRPLRFLTIWLFILPSFYALYIAINAGLFGFPLSLFIQPMVTPNVIGV